MSIHRNRNSCRPSQTRWIQWCGCLLVNALLFWIFVIYNKTEWKLTGTIDFSDGKGDIVIVAFGLVNIGDDWLYSLQWSQRTQESIYDVGNGFVDGGAIVHRVKIERRLSIKYVLRKEQECWCYNWNHRGNYMVIVSYYPLENKAKFTFSAIQDSDNLLCV